MDDVTPGGSDRPASAAAAAPGVLARCVAVEPDKFAAAHWGRAPLLSRAAELPNRSGFTDLLSPADADELLSRRGLRTPFLRIAKDGELLPAARFTGPAGPGPRSPTRSSTRRSSTCTPAAPRWCCRDCTGSGRPWSTSPATCPPPCGSRCR
ncbi:hypothetical protein GCM10027605_40200 [Micromonospora zhanjiangensis]